MAPGTSGPDRLVLEQGRGQSTAHAPATGGVRVGIGLPGARSVENWTEIVEPAATLAPVGETEATVRAGGRGGRGGGRLVVCSGRSPARAGAGDDEHGHARDEDHPPAWTLAAARVFPGP